MGFGKGKHKQYTKDKGTKAKRKKGNVPSQYWRRRNLEKDKNKYKLKLMETGSVAGEGTEE